MLADLSNLCQCVAEFHGRALAAIEGTDDNSAMQSNRWVAGCQWARLMERFGLTGARKPVHRLRKSLVFGGLQPHFVMRSMTTTGARKKPPALGRRLCGASRIPLLGEPAVAPARVSERRDHVTTCRSTGRT